MRRIILVFCSLLAAPAVLAGGGTETLTPGWDAFPGLTSGSVTWGIDPGSRTFLAAYSLAGAAPNQDHLVGFHHFDAIRPIVFGGGTTSLGSTPLPTTREGRMSAVVDTTFGFVNVDGGGNTAAVFDAIDANPGIYNIQFHVRQGGAPGCPVTSCDAIYRSGGSFASELVRFTVPGAIAFWSGDGDLEDEVGPNDVTAVGTIAYRSGNFREGFDLDGSNYLQIASAGAAGLAPASGFTVAAWVEQDTFSNTASVFNLRTPMNASGFTLEPQFGLPGTFLFAVNTTGVPEGFSTLSPGGFPFGTRFLVVATFDAATRTMRVYRDGELVAERNDVPGTNMALLGSESIAIGHNIVSNGNFDGLIDDVLYFDRALTPAELYDLFDFGLFGDGFE